LQYKLQLFLADRHGQDDLGKYLVGAALALCLVSMFAARAILYPASLVIFAYAIFRALSKNEAARGRELRWFLRAKSSVAGGAKARLRQFRERGTHSYYKCPNCRNTLRVPKVRGRIEIRCPQCHTAFERKRR
jgi:LSD1 subclass zinc finger protein